MEPRIRLGVFTSVVGIFLWAFTVALTNVWWIDPSFEFGLFQVLPIWFWVGLILHLSGIFLTIEYDFKYFFLIQIIFLNLMIWGTPAFVEQNASVTDSWFYLATAKTISQAGKIFVSKKETHVYLQYPSTFIFGSTFLVLSTVLDFVFLRFFPLLSSSIFIIGYYAWVRSIVKNHLCQKFVLLVFLFIDMWLFFHFCPQSFALMLLPLILLSLGKKERNWRATTILLYASSVIFHPTSSLIFFFILTGQYAISKLVSRRKIYESITVLLSGILWIGYFTFTVSIFFEGNLIRAYKNLVNISTSRAAYGETIAKMNFLAPTIRLITLTFTSLIGFFYIVSTRRTLQTFSFNMGWVFASFITIILDFISFHGEFSNRSLMLHCFLFAILFVQFFWEHESFQSIDHEHKKYIFFVLTSLLLINVSTVFYYENFNIVNDSNKAVSLFLRDKYDLNIYGKSLIASMITPLYYYVPEIEWRVGLAPKMTEELLANAIVVVDRHTLTSSIRPAAKEAMIELHDICLNRTGANCIYSNDIFVIYKLPKR